jgi:hypothetical protein
LRQQLNYESLLASLFHSEPQIESDDKVEFSIVELKPSSDFSVCFSKGIKMYKITFALDINLVSCNINEFNEESKNWDRTSWQPIDHLQLLNESLDALNIVNEGYCNVE